MYGDMKDLKKQIEKNDKVLLVDERNSGNEDVILRGKSVVMNSTVCSDTSVIDLYRTYDFSDKIVLIEEPACYGSLINYVKAGIMSEEEMMEALLKK